MTSRSSSSWTHDPQSMSIALTPTSINHVVFQLDSDHDDHGDDNQPYDPRGSDAYAMSPPRNAMPGASAQSEARANQARGKGKAKVMTASQVYNQMVSRNQLAQISIDELHRQQQALDAESSDPLAKPTKRHDGASYQALGDEDEDDSDLEHEHLPAPAPAVRRRPVHQSWLGSVRSGLDEWLSACRDTLGKSRRARWIFGICFLLVGAVLMGLALSPSQRSALKSWKGSKDTTNYEEEAKVDAVPAVDASAANMGGGAVGTGLFDLNSGQVGTWFKSLPGQMATGTLPFWATAASLPTGKASYTRGKHVIQTAVAGDTPIQAFNPFLHMGPLTPYKSSPGWGVDNVRYRDLSAVEQGTCTVSQVHILHRHGARYPTSDSPVTLIKKLAQAREDGVEFLGPLAFLQNWSYDLGAELLTPPGRLQLFHSGVQVHMQYAHLLGEQYSGIPAAAGRRSPVPTPVVPPQVVKRQWGSSSSPSSALVVRAGSQRRIVDSALSWLQGFYGPQLWNDFAFPPDSDLADPSTGAKLALKPRTKHHPRLDFQVHPEAIGWNTTLASNFACPNALRGNDTTSQRLRAFTNSYLAKAVERLQPYVYVSRAKGQGWDAKLTPALLNAMQQACSYETVAVGQSFFCSLFTVQEWKDYEQLWNLQFHGYDGAGTPMGAAQGIGWVNEFLSRLTNQPWDDQTQTSENRTINMDPERFPTDPTQRFYADFTHDSVLTSVLAALGMKQLNTIPSNGEEHARFQTSNLVPFAARMILERLSCGSSKAFVRMILNDAVVPLSDMGCPDRADGICALDDFLRALQDRNDRADYQHVCGAWDPKA